MSKLSQNLYLVILSALATLLATSPASAQILSSKFETQDSQTRETTDSVALKASGFNFFPPLGEAIRDVNPYQDKAVKTSLEESDEKQPNLCLPTSVEDEATLKQTFQATAGELLTFAWKVLNSNDDKSAAAVPLPCGGGAPVMMGSLASLSGLLPLVTSAERSRNGGGSAVPNSVSVAPDSVVEDSVTTLEVVVSDIISDPNNNGTDRVSSVSEIEPVPEPFTILGSAIAIGVGGLLNRKANRKD